MRLSIIGLGSWGTALAQVFSNNFENVIIWGRDEKVVNHLNLYKENFKYLPGIKLNENIKATTDITEAIKDKDIILLSIPTQGIRQFLENIKSIVEKSQIFISASKGIEISSLKFISQIIKEVLPVNEENIFVLSGPSFAKEVAIGLPTAITLAGNIKQAQKLQQVLNTKTFRLYITDDIKGVEIGGAVKNVIAIATGVSDGLNLGNNARASLITRGLYEMTKLANVFGARYETLYGLSGMGDLVLTSTGNLSRNRTFGILLGKGKSVEEALEEIGQVVEGYKTAKALKQISDRYNLELPISNIVYKILYERLNPKDAVEILMSRKPKKEFN